MAGLYTELFQDDRQGAETGEGRLQQVGADESGKPKPIQAHEVSKEKAHQHDGSCKSHDPALDTHDASPVGILNSSYLRKVGIAYQYMLN